MSYNKIMSYNKFFSNEDKVVKKSTDKHIRIEIYEAEDTVDANHPNIIIKRDWKYTFVLSGKSIADGIDRVIINPPATIIIWKDGSKTVVKCKDDEPFDIEKGVSMCFMKRMFMDSSSQMRKFMEDIEDGYNKKKSVGDKIAEELSNLCF